MKKKLKNMLKIENLFGGSFLRLRKIVLHFNWIIMNPQIYTQYIYPLLGRKVKFDAASEEGKLKYGKLVIEENSAKCLQRWEIFSWNFFCIYIWWSGCNRLEILWTKLRWIKKWIIYIWDEKKKSGRTNLMNSWRSGNIISCRKS